MKPLTILFTLVPLILTIISFIFTVLATTNKNWAYQHHYDGDNIRQSEWTTPLYTIYRSPFHVCSVSSAFPNATNSTSSFASANDPSTQVNASALTYTVTCARFKPNGFMKTSCEGLVGTNLSDMDARYGDDRMCQQIHMAGSLAIGSSVFVGFSLLALLVLVPLSIMSSNSGSAVTKGISLFAILMLLISAALLFLAQFYGVLGLVQSQIPNADFATDGNLPHSVGPWVQGIASIRYASTGWFAAILAAGCCAGVWGVARSASSGVASGTGTGANGEDKNV